MISAVSLSAFNLHATDNTDITDIDYIKHNPIENLLLVVPIFAKNNRFLNVFLSLSNTFFVKQLVVSNWIHQESLTAKGVKKQKFVWENFVPSHQRF